MKKLILSLLLSAAMILCGCSGEAEVAPGAEELTDSEVTAEETAEETAQSQVVALQKSHIGTFQSADGETEITIYGVSDEGDIYFSASWYRLNSFEGMAKLSGERAAFSVDNGYDSAAGELTFSEGAVTLDLQEATFAYLELGEYACAYSGELYTGAPYCQTEGGEHEMLQRYLEEEYPGSETDWEYRGTIYWEDELFDLYCVKADGRTRHLLVTYDWSEGDGRIGISELASGGEIIRLCTYDAQ